MLRRDRELRTQILRVKDAVLFASGLALAHFLRSLWHVDLLPGPHPVESFGHFAWLYFVIIPGAPFVLESQGFYRRPLFCSRPLTAWILLKSCALVVLGVILVMFLLKINLARTVIVLFGLTSFALVWCSEEALRVSYRSRFDPLHFKKRVLLVGTREETARMRSELIVKTDESIEIIGELDLNQSGIETLVQQLHEHSPNGVILSAKHSYFEQVEKAIQACELEGVEVWLLADFFNTSISQRTFDELYGQPVLIFSSTPGGSWQTVFKQGFDFVGALLAVTVLSPLFALIALSIKLTSPGPILFRQERSGLNGRPFTMLKFRSMVSDAEQRRHELQALNEMGGPVFKVTNDPRITPIGQFLRRHSLDELPQLFNVIRGEMSLVGPRPLPVYEVQRFDVLAHRRRLSVKPGLTCLWQVSGRNEVKDFRDWVRLDLEYIDNWSLWLDLKILLRTIPVLFTGTGAK
jgi:exopolysaccharide biosynthesis polyprenyl glycosylphosphotransferase